MVYIVLTLKNVVLIAVAIDVCTSVILGDDVVYFSRLAKLKHVKGSVSVHAQVARLDAGRRGLHCLDLEERRPHRHQRAHKVARLDAGRRWSTLS